MAAQLRTGAKLIVLAGVIGGTYLWLLAYQQQLTFAPTIAHHRTPAAVGLAFEKIEVVAGDGVTLRGWFVPAATNNAPVALYLPDTTGNIADRLGRARLLHDCGLGVVLVDYRGFGDSAGLPRLAGLRQDALAAYFVARDKAGGNARRLFFYGEGFGAVVAVDLAARTDCAGLIFEGAYPSLAAKLADAQPRIPWPWLIGHEWDATRRLPDLRVPVLALHSADDEQVALAHGRRLYAAAGGARELVEIQGRHADAVLRSREQVAPRLTEFVARAGRN